MRDNSIEDFRKFAWNVRDTCLLTSFSGRSDRVYEYGKHDDHQYYYKKAGAGCDAGVGYDQSSDESNAEK